MNLIQQIEAEEIAKAAKTIPEFRAGDTVRVGVKVIEGDRSRVQMYEGVCIARSNRSINSNFTVRKMSFGEGVNLRKGRLGTWFCRAHWQSRQTRQGRQAASDECAKSFRKNLRG